MEVGINEHIPVKSFKLDDESTAPQCNKLWNVYKNSPHMIRWVDYGETDGMVYRTFSSLDEHLLCTRHYSKHFTCINLFNPYSKGMW